MGNRCGRPRLSESERYEREYINDRLYKERKKQETKVLQDMAKYKINRIRLAKKASAARAAGLSYGYYVALVLEKRGRLAL